MIGHSGSKAGTSPCQREEIIERSNGYVSTSSNQVKMLWNNLSLVCIILGYGHKKCVWSYDQESAYNRGIDYCPTTLFVAFLLLYSKSLSSVWRTIIENL